MIPSTIQTSRGEFGYFEHGHGPLVLFLHGFPDSPDAFLPVIERMRGYRAVAPFLRGYAPSVLGGPYDLESLALDVRALVDALAPGQPIALVGHDWGAVITYVASRVLGPRVTAAVTMSVPHPLSFLRTLASNSAQLRRSWYMGFFQIGRLADARVSADNFAFIDRLFATWSPGLRAPKLDNVKRAIAPGFPAALEYYRSMVRPFDRAIARARADARIAVPTLHLTGADDGCIGPEVGRDQHRYFDAPFASEVIRGAGHFLQWERPELVAERAHAWIASHSL